MRKNLVIGVLGGMGTYATIHFFQQYAEAFPAEREWERPRIVIDNRCTMPSRVRAYLFNEKVDQLVDEMTDSLKSLINAGCNRVILACNTSHLFLPSIYKKAPELKEYIVNIIDSCVRFIVDDYTNNVLILGSEGTIDSQIYQNAMRENGINYYVPEKEEYTEIRECIEAVKRDRYTEATEATFLSLVNRYDACILGCTELPILYQKYQDKIKCKKVYDPLMIGLLKLKEECDNE